MLHEPRILIVGAGPTGLGAAWRLQELGYDRWRLIEGETEPGGLAASVVDNKGFTWDLGGHVLFSHYEYFDRLMDTLLGEAWVEHVRESWVWMRGRFIPYPFQNNLWRMPAEELIVCLSGLVAIQGSTSPTVPPANFCDWIVQHFGTGIADVFMLPYNRKVWACDPRELDVGWTGERVAPVNLCRILENLVRQRDDAGWGPNARFRFPLHGGTGAIWRALYARLPRNKTQLGQPLTGIRASKKEALLASGEVIPYDVLLSTVPLNSLLRLLRDVPTLSTSASSFMHSGTHVVGIGIADSLPPVLTSKCWIYFPEPEVPFYRVTVFSNYSPHNVPQPGQQWSLQCEVSESPSRPVKMATVVEEVVAGLRTVDLLPDSTKILSRWHRRLEHGYPSPFLGRDSLLAEVDPLLRENGIWIRGRFGAWKYEVSNQDHSLMQGVEAIDHVLFGTDELTYHHPGIVNAAKQVGLRARRQP